MFANRHCRRTVLCGWAIALFGCLVLSLSLAGCGNSNSATEQEGKVQAPITSSSAMGENYADIVTQFEKAGFTNITTEGLEDLITGFLHEENDVKEISIDGDTSYKKDEWFDPDARVVIRYHSYPETSSAQNADESSDAGDKDEDKKSGGDKEKSSKKESAKTAKDEASDESAKSEDVPKEYRTALKSAESYSKVMHMSKAGIYDQLTSEYGDKYSPEAAQYAVDNVKADWKANALESAKNYQDLMNMSPAAIYDQLISEYGDKFTPEEAQYAVDNL